MSDPAIKLFGKTIPLPPSPGGGGGGEGRGGDGDKGSPNHQMCNSVNSDTNNRDEGSTGSQERAGPVLDSSPATAADHDPQKPLSDDQEEDNNTPPAAAAMEQDQKSSSDQQQQQPNNNDDNSNNPQADKSSGTLKKPDKILPCPRCSSMDTKFCYYNNYNVNQPRHFCKNCQRYWTAGGTMRNVPVGAGRRKNKNSTAASHYRHLTTMADAAAALQAMPDHPSAALRPNGTVLSFGSDTPLCESMASVLNLAEKAMKSCNRNGFIHHRLEEPSSMDQEQSTGSSATASNSTTEEADPAGINCNCQGFGRHVPYINSSPWPYPWGAPPAPPTPGAAPQFCASSFPVPIYPATAYWGCGAWSMPWMAPLGSPSPTSAGSSAGSGPNSPTLGKHSRDGNVLVRSNSNSSSERGGETPAPAQGNLWIPKTLRIDDPGEAAKSSIWATMGFKKDKADGISSAGGLFKSFQSKAELRNDEVEASPAMQANPAALSRSMNFQESS